MQRCSRCILQHPQPTGLLYTRWGRGSNSSAEMQSVYSTAPHSRLGYWTLVGGGSLTPLQRCSQCLLQHPTADWATGHSLMEGVLLLCRDAVGVFYSTPSRLGYCTLVEGEGLTPLQRCSRCILQHPPSRLGYWTLVEGGSLTPLQRCSRCILQQPQPTGLLDTRCGRGSNCSAEMLSVYSTAPASRLGY